MTSLKEAMSQVGLMTPADCKPTAPFTVKPFPADAVIAGWIHRKIDGYRATLKWNGSVLTARSKNGKRDYAHHLSKLSDLLVAFHAPAFTVECELYTGKGGTSSFTLTSAILGRLIASGLSETLKIHLLYPNCDVIGFFKEMNPLDIPYLSHTHDYPQAERDWNTAKLSAEYQLHQMNTSDLEGLVIETLDGTYYKWLPDNELDGVVVDWTAGEGKYQGAIGALVVQVPDGKQHTVASGLTHQHRLMPFEELRGLPVTIKYKNIQATGALRHARLQFKELV